MEKTKAFLGSSMLKWQFILILFYCQIELSLSLSNEILRNESYNNFQLW